MRAVSLAIGVASMLVVMPATADDLRLAWTAPAGCPSGQQVHDAAVRTAGSARREPLEADVHVDRSERWSVSIRTKRAGVASTERRLEAASCSALADATAVILALALIPPAADTAAATATTIPATTTPAAPPAIAAPSTAPATPTPSLDPTAPVPSTSTVVAPPQAPADGDQTPSSDPYAHAVGAGASLVSDASTLPAAAAGGQVALAWTPGRARLEVAGAYFSGQSKTTGSSQAGAELSLLVAGVRGCWSIVRSAVELSPCAGADVQMVKAKGFGATTNYDASAAWVSAAGGALVRVPVTSWLALRGEVDALVPLTRPRFVVEGDGAVHRPASIGARAGIGAEILFL